MSALEPGLLAQLIDEPMPSVKALQKIVTLFSENDRMSSHELRVLEIVLEGLGMPPALIRTEIETAIQRRRDRIEALHGPWGVNHAAP
jgi:hypothetical protein